MEPITITINGREVSGHPGMTILELARESGIDIPTLCHDPHLTPIGACRICVVEDERSGALAASCVTPIAAGMVINTESPKVLERRKTIIKLILASHPDSCLVCDKGNRCELRRIASEMGIGEVEFQKIPQTASIEEVNPFIERDLSKCILCARCIRADHELVVEGAIDYIGRGFTSKPATLGDVPLENSECTFCGTCVAMCPTGALMEKQWEYRGTATASVLTICPFCGCGCSIEMEVRGNRIARAKPGKKGTVNSGALCVRGSYGYDFVHSAERLTAPLVRVNGELKATSWEQALDAAAAGLNQVKQGHGSDSLAILGSPGCTNEENYLLQRFARTVAGTNNIDNGGRLYSAASIVGLGSSLGFPGTTSRLDNLERADLILVIGANLDSSAPIVGYAVKRAVKYKNARLLLVDPQQTRLSAFAHLWLRPRIGTDLALINGLANVIVTEGLQDEEFVSRKTDNFREMGDALARYSPDFVEEVTGVPADEIRRAARLFAGANLASIVYGNGITQHVDGTDNVTALANLAMLTGNIGIGGGIFAMQRDCNGLGAWDMGAMPDSLPGYQPVEDDQARKRFEERWGVGLPAAAGLTAMEMLDRAAEGGVRGMCIMGEDPLLSFPHPDRVREALSSLDFLVVQDMFLTETAKLAKVVLPSASFAEKEGTFTNFEGRVQRVRRVIPPVAGSLPDGEIVLRLAAAMGHPMPYSSLQEVMDEIQELVPLYQITEYTEAKGSYRVETDMDSLSSRRIYKGKFPGGFGRFSPVQYEPRAAVPQDGYPLTLLAGSTLFHCGNGSKSSRAIRLGQFSPQAYLEIGEHDAKKFGISQSDRIRIVSPVGEVTAEAKLTGRLPEGVLFMPVSFPANPANRLFGVEMDPRTKAPALKACAVRLERI